MHDIRTAIRSGTVELGFFRGSQAEGLLPLLLFVKLVRIGVGVRGFVAHQPHEPVLRLALNFQDHFALQPPQPLVHQKEGDENRRDSHRTKPFVTHETRRMKRETFHREFVIELFDQRLPLGPLQL